MEQEQDGEQTGAQAGHTDPAAQIEYLPVVGLDDEDDGRDEEDTPEDLAAAGEATAHTHEGVIGHRAE